jgi:NADH dehydrogenase
MSAVAAQAPSSQPLPYQCATAARKQQNATVLMAEVRATDATTRRVQIDALSIPYDYLVLATGAAHCYFSHEGWAQTTFAIVDGDATGLEMAGRHL